ncbi:unnamed protein product [Arabidopsis halleri]
MLLTCHHVISAGSVNLGALSKIKTHKKKSFKLDFYH